MEIRELEALERKIADLKVKRAKAEGQLESIVAGWKADYGFSTLDEAVAQKKKLEERLTQYEEHLGELEAALRKAIPEGAL